MINLKHNNYNVVVKQLRQQAGLTLEQAEEYTGISSRTISRYENGQYEPSLYYVLKISELAHQEVLIASASWFL